MPSSVFFFILFTLTISATLHSISSLPDGYPFYPDQDLHQYHPFHRQPGYATHNYKDALTKSILYFEGQRSGKLPRNQRMTWRKDSGLSDGSEAHVDLVGGYYDAGDNVKFGFPMAFTATMLSWSVIEFGGMMKSELQNAKQAIRWGTDYLLKATVHPNTIYVQVGEGNSDHACWERPEDMDTPRHVYKIDENNPGTEVAAETAAALAAASIVFRKCDRAYSNILLNRAIKVFEFANNYRGSYSEGSLKPIVAPFYQSFSGYEDELLWGAAWLHRATRNPMYLNYIHRNGNILGSDEADYTFGWDNKHVGARILLSKSFFVQRMQDVQDFKIHSDNYICSLIPGGRFSQTQYTPGGLLFKMDDANMQYVTSTSFLLLTYAKYLKHSRMTINCGGSSISASTLRNIAKKQVDYILGSNPLKMSYMVGYGPKYPQRVHHRGASLPSVSAHPQKIQCNAGFSFMNSQSPNPNVLTGAIVGGPDQSDRFGDVRSDYAQSEPATYFNAPLVGALAYLAHSSAQI